MKLSYLSIASALQWQLPTPTAAQANQSTRSLLHYTLECATTCSPELCSCISTSHSPASCASQLHEVCTTNTIDECVPSKGINQFRSLHCPYAACLVDGRSNAECSCEIHAKACEIYENETMGYCETAQCCKEASSEEERSECLAGEQTTGFRNTPTLSPAEEVESVGLTQSAFELDDTVLFHVDDNIMTDDTKFSWIDVVDEASEPQPVSQASFAEDAVSRTDPDFSLPLGYARFCSSNCDPALCTCLTIKKDYSACISELYFSCRDNTIQQCVPDAYVSQFSEVYCPYAECMVLGEVEDQSADSCTRERYAALCEMNGNEEDCELAKTNAPTEEPSLNPTKSPSDEPSENPTTRPSKAPITDAPSPSPSHSPSISPSTDMPSTSPIEPSDSPTSSSPSVSPSLSPVTAKPSPLPSISHTSPPITDAPSLSPVTDNPSQSPSSSPSVKPTKRPSPRPSKAPVTDEPSINSSIQSSLSPITSPVTPKPSKRPSAKPVTAEPSGSLTVEPSFSPTAMPSWSPTFRPSMEPSLSPVTAKPSIPPSNPKAMPSWSPTFQPSMEPSLSPITAKPSIKPSKPPSPAPVSSSPSKNPVTLSPSKSPVTSDPTAIPSTSPSGSPTTSPTTSNPSKGPTPNPSSSPSTSPVTEPPTEQIIYCPETYDELWTSSYDTGTQVEVSGFIYECNPYPYSIYCKFKDYQPVYGSELWSDAWTEISACQSPSNNPTESPTSGKPSARPTSLPTSLSPSTSPTTRTPTPVPSNRPTKKIAAPKTSDPTTSPSDRPTMSITESPRIEVATLVQFQMKTMTKAMNQYEQLGVFKPSCEDFLTRQLFGEEPRVFNIECTVTNQQLLSRRMLSESSVRNLQQFSSLLVDVEATGEVLPSDNVVSSDDVAFGDMVYDAFAQHSDMFINSLKNKGDIAGIDTFDDLYSVTSVTQSNRKDLITDGGGSGSQGIKTGALAALVIGGVAFVLLIIAFVFQVRIHFADDESLEEDESLDRMGLDLPPEDINVISEDSAQRNDSNLSYAFSLDDGINSPNSAASASKPVWIEGAPRRVQREVIAPAGKLGIIIDTSSQGPIVHSVKAGSVLEGLVFEGDLIISLDDEDTTNWSAHNLTKLVASRSKFERRITLLSGVTL